MTAKKGKQTQFDSKSGVSPKRTHGTGIWGGSRDVASIRLDAKLYKATKPLLIQYFGSVCGAIEPYLASIHSIVTTKKFSEKGGVIPSITVDIGNMNITRHMKPRRKLTVDNVGNYVTSFPCYADGCGREAVAMATYLSTGSPWKVCGIHLAECKRQPKKSGNFVPIKNALEKMDGLP